MKRILLLVALAIGCSHDVKAAKPPDPIEFLNDDIQDVTQAYIDICVDHCGTIFFGQIHSVDKFDIAFTQIFVPGLSRIQYEPDNMLFIREKYGRAATIAIFGHEIGHHVSAMIHHHTHIAHETPILYKEELSADKFSGCLLYKMGLPIQGWGQLLIDLQPDGSWTHPPARLRIDATVDGYNTCKNMDANP